MVTTRQCSAYCDQPGLSDIICILRAEGTLTIDQSEASILSRDLLSANQKPELRAEGTLTTLTTHSPAKIYMRFHKYSTVKLEKWHQIAPVNTWFIATNYPITYTLTIYQQFSQIQSPEIRESVGRLDSIEQLVSQRHIEQQD